MEVPTASIDAIVQIPHEQVSAVVTMQRQHHEASGSSTPQSTVSNSGVGDQQQLHKRKGHKRLLLSLRSMASSPSLAKMSKMRPYRSGNRASMSCVSLSTPYQQPGHGSSESNFSQQFSTAPTSVASSPGPATPTRLRTFSRDGSATVGLPSSVRPASPCTSDGMIEEADECYFSCPDADVLEIPKRKKFEFWNEMPTEIRMQIMAYLTPKEIVRCSSISKSWYSMCFDGQLWQRLDTAAYYRDIPSEALVNIIKSAGPFVRDLNLRGCIQLRDAWTARGIAHSCKNLENFSLEGCLIDRTSIHSFLDQNTHLVHVNLSGLPGASNETMKIIARHCPKLEHLNVTWCSNINTNGLQFVLNGCPHLKDLRAGETRGWDNVDFALQLFEKNALERLILTNCESLTDDVVSAIMEGVNGEIDYNTGRVICEPRILKHLDLSRCRAITDIGVKAMAYNVPYLEGLQLAKLTQLTDSSLTLLFPTLNVLTHLDLEELEHLTNASLLSLANSPTAPYLRHLGISYCEDIGDAGMLPILRKCTNIESLDMDNTRISDLVLIEAAANIRERNRAAALAELGTPSITVGLRMAVYDCAGVTWNGVLEILSRNAEKGPMNKSNGDRGNDLRYEVTTAASPPQVPHYHHIYISLKAFYTWQPTIVEHSRRVQAGHFDRAKRLERKWAEFMMMGEEVLQGGRRRRRRMREALAAMAGEHEEDGVTRPGRRRARSDGLGVSSGGSCIVM
jgi:F-box and leucine-rich repeat protein 2/20